MGCAAISASYPFIPTRLSYLLGLVVGLGSISAVAFSTSYQLVAWFRCGRGSVLLLVQEQQQSGSILL